MAAIVYAGIVFLPPCCHQCINGSNGLRKMAGKAAAGGLDGSPVLHRAGGAAATRVDADEPQLVEGTGSEGDGGGDDDACGTGASGEE